MKRIIYILILIGAFAINLEMKAEWIAHNNYKNTNYIDTTYGKIIDYKIVEDKTIWAVTENNQILSYDLETGNIISHCQCEFDTIPSFKEVSSDGKTTSFAFFDQDKYFNRKSDSIPFFLKIITLNNQNCTTNILFDFNFSKRINKYHNLGQIYFQNIDVMHNKLFLAVKYKGITDYKNNFEPSYSIEGGFYGVFEKNEDTLKDNFFINRYKPGTFQNEYFFKSNNVLLRGDFTEHPFYYYPEPLVIYNPSKNT